MLLKQSESTAARRRIPIVLVDATDGVSPETGITLSSGDLKLSKNGGAEANHAGSLIELADGDYYYEATAGELDTPGYLTGRLTKAGVRTYRFLVQVVAFDPYAATNLGLSSLPTENPGTADGLFIAGTNAATEVASLAVSGEFAVEDGIAVSCTTADKPAIQAVGNGEGAGASFAGGSGGGDGIIASGVGGGSGIVGRGDSSGGHGIKAIASGTPGNALHLSSEGLAGPALRVTQSSGPAVTVDGQVLLQDGLAVSCTTANRSAVTLTGNGSGHALSLTPGATGNALRAIGGATSGDAVVIQGTAGNARGMLIQGQGSNDGLEITAGATGIGLDINGGSSSGAGATVDSTSGDALQITAGGGNGDAVQLAGNGSGHGLLSTGGATGSGIRAIGGATSGAAVHITATAGNANAVTIAGHGSGDGLDISGGATGIGVDINGGSSSGAGLTIDSISGDALTVVAGGGNGDAAYLQGHGSGSALYARAGTTSATAAVRIESGNGTGIAIEAGQVGGTGNGISIFAGYTSGDAIRLTANEGAGIATPSSKQALNLSGAFGAAAVQIAQNSSNGPGLSIQGFGTGAAVLLTGGATGPGVDINGGSTSGAGVVIDSTTGDAVQVTSGGGDGDAVQLTGNGTGLGLRVNGVALATQSSVDTINGIVDAILVDTGTTLQAELDGIQADTEDIQSRLPAALISGRIDASVGAMASDSVTAAALATDAVAEIQAGLATASGVATLQLSLDDVPTNAELSTALDAADDAVLSAIGAIAIPSASTIATAVLTTELTESYRANGAAPTLAQAQFELLAHHGEASNSGTTKTLKGIDHTTTVATFTYDDATNPSSVTRAT